MIPDFEYIKETTTRTIRLRLLANGIIHYTYLPNVEVDENDHVENHKALVELTGGIKHPLLIDSDYFISVTPKGREMIRQLEPQAPISVRALVIRSLSHRILSNFYIRFHKPIVPTSVFDSYAVAMNYLMESLKK